VRRSDRFRTFALLIALFATFAFVTAPFFSWSVPTLDRGSAFTAAMLVPPRATRRARHATTMAGEGRRKSFRIE